MYDVAIIGAGIVGTSIARELARYRLKTVVMEKEADVANGTTKANSAIVHAGYDPEPGTLKAKLNLRGNLMYERICSELGVPFKKTGSMVIAFQDKELKTLESLYKRGQENGVPGLEIIDTKQLFQLEGEINKDARGALYAPSAGIVDPYLLAIALAENAAENGVEIWRETPVISIEKTGNNTEPGYTVYYPGGAINVSYIINGAGLYADKLNQMVNTPYFQIEPNRGEYFLLDKTSGGFVNHVIFSCPTELSKGVLMAPTAHGNLIVGPNAEPVENKDALETTARGLEEVREQAEKLAKNVPLHEVITTFSGLRGKTEQDDFIIEEARDAPGFINVAGIDSPGLAAAPAIACYLVELLQGIAGSFKTRGDFTPERSNRGPFMNLNNKEKNRLIKEEPGYGRIVCRCESITEGEIVEAIHAPVGARTVDGLKKRVRTGSGRCQGGFCTPKVMNILSRELGVEMNEVTKDSNGSYLLTHPTKEQETQEDQKNQKVQKKASKPELKLRDLPKNSGETGETTKIEVHHTSQQVPYYDLVVIGGGPAGMAAAEAARENGVTNILVMERDIELGGILQQCIHNGFGLHIFKEELTGPEYAERFIEKIQREGIDCKLDTMVLSVGKDRQVTYINSREGVAAVQAGAIILSMGCRERTRGAVNVPGTRPAGIFTSGTAQRFVNMEGYLVGRKVVVFGSGDIGLIMARRMVLEGAEVEAVLERKPYSEGLVRNRVQCLEDYNIPLLLKHTIVDIKGKTRVEGITVAQVDENKKPVKGTEWEIECDTVLFSRGLIPENELSKSAGVELAPVTHGPVVNESMETSVPGIFACGNVVHVHDLVDWVTRESRIAGRGASDYLFCRRQEQGYTFQNRAGAGINYLVPHRVRTGSLHDSLELYMRVKDHHARARLVIKADGEVIKKVKRKGLTPGDMVVIKIKKDELPGKSFKELTVELEKEEG